MSDLVYLMTTRPDVIWPWLYTEPYYTIMVGCLFVVEVLFMAWGVWLFNMREAKAE